MKREYVRRLKRDPKGLEQFVLRLKNATQMERAFLLATARLHDATFASWAAKKLKQEPK